MKNAWLVLGAVLAAALVFEVGLRAAGVAYPVFHRLERERGWAPWPGAEGVYTGEGRAQVRFNRDGMRGPELPRDKPEGVFRIAVLGDSFTEARGVPEDETFVARLAPELAACPALSGRRVRPLNFGVSGYGTAQEYLTLDTALAYEPDLVVLAFYAGNDVSNNSRALDGHEDRPYFVPDGGGLALDRSTLDTWRFRLKRVWRNSLNAVVNHVRLFQLVRDAVNKARYGLRGPARLQPRFMDPGVEDRALRPPETKAWRDAWTVTERLLARMDAGSEKAGAGFLVTMLSVPVQVYPDAQARRAFARGQGVDTLFYPERRLSAFGEAAGIPVITLAPTMQRLAERMRVHFHGLPGAVPGDGHYNEKGHAVAARLIAQGVCDRLAGAGNGRPAP